MKALLNLLKTTFIEWNKKDPFRQSAVIAYYAIFSIPGLLVLIITIAGYFFGRDIVARNILDQVTNTMGENTSIQIKQMLANASKTKSTILGSIIGGLILISGAIGVFAELQKTLNIIWEVKSIPKKGIWPFIKTRLFSFGLVLAIAFLMIVSLVISTAITAITDLIKANSSEILAASFHVLNFIFSLGIVSLLFALMFKVLPEAKTKWKYVWLGALMTGLLFTLGKTALTIYFEKAQPASAYGAAGSIILILLWVSYSSMIMFFGAQFTFTYENIHANKSPVLEPSDIRSLSN